MVGDGSFPDDGARDRHLGQEGYKLIIVLLDSSGYASIGGLSRSIGSDGFDAQFDYDVPIDLAANAASLGAVVFRANDRAAFDEALQSARAADRTTVIYARVDRLQGVPGRIMVGRSRRRSVGAAGGPVGARRLGRAPESQATLVA